MEESLVYRDASDSGEELESDSDDSWASFCQNASDIESNAGSDSDLDLGPFGDAGVSSTSTTTPKQACGRRGRGRKGHDVPNLGLVWEFYHDDDPYSPEWLSEHRGGGILVPEEDYKQECVDFFKYFFPDSLVDIMVEQTNIYAERVLRQTASSYRKDQWADTNADELRAFIGLQICMGIYPQCGIANHWSSNFIYENKFGTVMARNRFQYINSFLHFSDNTLRLPRADPMYNPLDKVQPLIDQTESLYKDLYEPHRDLSIDETMIAFKGRHHMKQYLPDKPHKWGFKLFTLADPRDNYCIKFKFYTGKEHFAPGGPGDNMGEKVVFDLISDYVGKGHIIYTDSFYTSPMLFTKLQEMDVGATGTCVENRKEFPTILKKKSLTLKKNESPKFARAENLVCCAWHDTKRVHLLSTVHTNNTVEKIVRSRQHESGFRETEKPVMADVYNHCMGGVDHFNQKIGTYLYPYRAVKWYHPIYHFIKEVALVNGYIIYSKCATSPLSSWKFRLNVAEALVKKYATSRKLQKRHQRMGTHVNIDRLSGAGSNHFPGHYEDIKHRPRCVVCSESVKRRVQTRFYCVECEVPLCVTPCFRLYHTVVDYVAAKKASEAAKSKQ